MKETKWFNVGNNFDKATLKEVIEQLEEGQKIEIGVSCIGHTRNNMVQEAFREALVDYYKDRSKMLVTEYNEGAYSYSYTYMVI